MIAYNSMTKPISKQICSSDTIDFKIALITTCKPEIIIQNVVKNCQEKKTKREQVTKQKRQQEFDTK